MAMVILESRIITDLEMLGCKDWEFVLKDLRIFRGFLKIQTNKTEAVPSRELVLARGSQGEGTKTGCLWAVKQELKVVM